MALTPTQAANAMAQLFDTPLLKALSEPARIEVLKVLLATGGGDVASVAAQLPQDRSVISRHLQALEASGILRSQRHGRHRVYELDGAGFVERFDVLARRLKELAPLCCAPGRWTKPTKPPDGTSVRAAKKPDGKTGKASRTRR